MQIWIFDFFCRDLIFLEITKEIYNNRQERKLAGITKFRLKSCEKYVKLCSFMEKSYQNSYIMLQYGESNEKRRSIMKHGKLWSAVLSAAMVMGTTVPILAADMDGKLVVIHTNDIHGY